MSFNPMHWPFYACPNTIRHGVPVPTTPRPFTEEELLLGTGSTIGYDCRGGYFIHWIHTTHPCYVDGFKAIQLKYEQSNHTYRVTVWFKKVNNNGPASITFTDVPLRRLFDFVKRAKSPEFPYVVINSDGNHVPMCPEDSLQYMCSLMNEISDDGVFMPGEAPWPPVLPKVDTNGNDVPPGTR